MTISQRAARKRTTEIKSSLRDIEQKLREFHALSAWLPLGYSTFTEWWDSELGPIPVATGLRNWIIFAMVDETPRTTAGKLTNGYADKISDSLGTTSHAVKSVVSRARYRTKITGKGDHEFITLSVLIPNLWRRHIIRTAELKRVNMADLMRPIILDGMKRKHGVDLNESVKATA